MIILFNRFTRNSKKDRDFTVFNVSVLFLILSFTFTSYLDYCLRPMVNPSGLYVDKTQGATGLRLSNYT